MTAPLATGLDISSNQHPNTPQHPQGQPLDFVAAKDAGWSFVVVKATEGATYRNPWFAADVKAAAAAGFAVEAYHWVSPTSTASAQAANVIQTLKAAGYSGRVWLDFEQAGASHQLLDDVRAQLHAAQRATGTYTYPEYWKVYGNRACAACAADPLWFAWSFPEEPTPAAVEKRGFVIAPWQRVDVWQYAGTSVVVPGMPGKQDANRLLSPLPGLVSSSRRYRMLVFAQGLDATTALAVCASRRIGVATTSIDEAKAAIARGDKVVVLGGPAAEALALTAPTGHPTTTGATTVAIGATADDTLTLACQLIH